MNETNNQEKKDRLKELILLAKAGDNSAFEEVYNTYYTPLFRYIFVRTKDKEETEDMTQTVFLKIWSSIPSWNKDHTSPLSFFFTVARNTLIDYYRKSSHEPIVSDAIISKYAEENSADGDSSAREIKEVLLTAVSQLSEEQQEIIRLYYTNDLTYREIAEITGKREDAIRQLHSRAVKKLRELYKY